MQLCAETIERKVRRRKTSINTRVLQKIKLNEWETVALTVEVEIIRKIKHEYHLYRP